MCTGLVEGVLGLPVASRLGGSVHFFIFDLVKILIVVSLMIFAVSYLRSYFHPRKAKALLERVQGPNAHLAAALLGIVTPFCSCSTVPIFIGFVEAGIPLGVTFSFLVTSPIVNEAAFAILIASFGWKIAVVYAAMGVCIGVGCGMLIARLKPEKYLEPDALSGAAYDRVGPAMKQRERLAFARRHLAGILLRIWPFLVAGIGVGAVIYGWVPDLSACCNIPPGDMDTAGYGPGTVLVARILTSDQPLSVLLAVLFGIPFYSSALGTIPVAEALIGKGVGLGTALAFMMAVTALSLPEMILLRKVMKPRLIVLFAGTAAAGILLVGLFFNLVI